MKLKSMALLALGFLAGAAVHSALSNNEIEVWSGVFNDEDEEESENDENLFDEGEPIPGTMEEGPADEQKSCDGENAAAE